MVHVHSKVRWMAMTVLAAVLTMGLYAPMSVPQQDKEPIGINVALCFDNSDPTAPKEVPYGVLQILKANGISAVNPTVTQILPLGDEDAIEDQAIEGDVLLIAKPPGPNAPLERGAQVDIEAKDAMTGNMLMISLIVVVIPCIDLPPLPLQPPPGGPPVPPGNPPIPIAPAAVTLCVGETAPIPFYVRVPTGVGTFQVGLASIVELDAALLLGAIFIDTSRASTGVLEVTGMAPGQDTFRVKLQLDQLGLLTQVSNWFNVVVTVVSCPPPPTPPKLCPPGTARQGLPQLGVRPVAPVAPQKTGFPPPLLNDPPRPYIGLERFEVGVRIGTAPAGAGQWPFPNSNGFNLLKGQRTSHQGELTDFYEWGAPYQDPTPPDPAPHRRFPTRWVAFRGYFKCAAPIVIFKFEDLNGNGQLDAGEPGVEGWPIMVTDPQGGVAAALDVDGGFYEFTPRIVGNYQVSEGLLPGWLATTPTSANVAVVERESPEKGLLEPTSPVPVPKILIQRDIYAIFGNRKVPLLDGGIGLLPGFHPKGIATVSLPDSTTGSLNGLLAIANEGGNSLSIINLTGIPLSSRSTQGSSGQIQSIRVGTAPHSVALNSDGTRAFVGNFGSGNVSVVDIPNGRVIETIRVGNQVTALTFDPKSNKVYTTNFGDASVSVIQIQDGGSRVTATIRNVREPLDIELSPDGQRAYVSSQRDSVYVLDLTTASIVTRISVGSTVDLRKLAVSPDGSRLFVATRTNQQGAGQIAVIDTASLQVVQKISVDSFPFGVTITPSARCLVVTHTTPNKVSFVELTNNQVLTVLTDSAAKEPQESAILGSRSYVTNRLSDNISVFDLGSCR